MATKKNEDADVAKGPDGTLGLDRIATEISVARHLLGLSQSQLASKTGLSRNAIMGYESGRNKPGAREIKLLCEALRITPNKLLFGREAPFDLSEDESSLIPQEVFSDERLMAAFAGLKFSLLLREEQLALLTLIDNLLKSRTREPFFSHLMADTHAVEVVAENMALLRSYGSKWASQLLESIESSK